MGQKYTAHGSRIPYGTSTKVTCLHLLSLMFTIGLVTPSLAWAADSSGTNVITGTRSANTNNASTTTQTNISSNNKLATNNDVTLHLNTGNNSMIGNTVAGPLATGEVNAKV